MAYIYPFRMTSTTATLLLIDPVSQEVIIGVRSDSAWVYPGADSLPGGFMEARWTKDGEDGFLSKLSLMVSTAARVVLDWVIGDAERYHEGEDGESCAIREAHEEMGLDLTRDQLVLFAARANARTDTRAHVTNLCYYAELTPEQSALVPHGADVSHLDDLKGIKRVPIGDLFLEIPNIEARYPMAFNHFEVMIQGLIAWEKARDHEARIKEVETLWERVHFLERENSNLSWAADGRQGGI